MKIFNPFFLAFSEIIIADRAWFGFSPSFAIP
jgi:hypothetical protein